MDFNDETIRVGYRAVTTSYRWRASVPQSQGNWSRITPGPGYGRDVRPEQYLNTSNQAVDAYTMAAKHARIRPPRGIRNWADLRFTTKPPSTTCSRRSGLATRCERGCWMRFWPGCRQGFTSPTLVLSRSSRTYGWTRNSLRLKRMSLEDFVYDTSAKKFGHASSFRRYVPVSYDDF